MPMIQTDVYLYLQIVLTFNTYYIYDTLFTIADDTGAYVKTFNAHYSSAN